MSLLTFLFLFWPILVGVANQVAIQHGTLGLSVPALAATLPSNDGPHPPSQSLTMVEALPLPSPTPSGNASLAWTTANAAAVAGTAPTVMQLYVTHIFAPFPTPNVTLLRAAPVNGLGVEDSSGGASPTTALSPPLLLCLLLATAGSSTLLLTG